MPRGEHGGAAAVLRDEADSPASTKPNATLSLEGRKIRASPIADDGDELRFCSTCAFGSVCLPQGVDKAALHELHCLVEHVGPYRAGDHIFRTGESVDCAARGDAGCGRRTSTRSGLSPPSRSTVCKRRAARAALRCVDAAHVP